jgi:CO/xanthine dehydrogenase Mo-binding subunit
MSITGPTLTRRDFVKVGGAMVVTLAVLPETFTPHGAVAEAATTPDATRLASWLEIKADGTIIAKTGRAEMGIGMSAYYPQLIAEELSVRPESIALVMADTDRTPDAGWSASLMDGAQNQRKVAAYAYQALLSLASTALGVPVSALSVKDGVVSGGGKSVSYAALVKGQELELTIPVTGVIPKVNDAGTSISGTAGMTVTGTPPMKSVSSYTVIGTSYPSPQVRDKITAKTQWVGDVRLPGMLHARMVRPATLGSTLMSAGTIDKSKFPTAEVVVKKNLVAVVSPNEWEAVGGARAVAANTKWTPWSGLPARENLMTVIRGDRTPTGRGDQAKVEEALKGSAKVISATYQQPYVKHAPISPFIAVADVKADGTATVWAHSAQSQGLRAHLAYMLGVGTDKVTVKWLEGAGQYGRTSMGGDGAEADAVILSQLLGKPVRVQWTLQDDLAWSTASCAWIADLRAGLDANGKLTALTSDFYTPSQLDYRLLGAVLAGLPTIKVGGGAGGASFGGPNMPNANTPYTIQNQFHRGAGMLSLGSDTGVGIRGNIMRTPGHRQHIFMLESMLNEAAASAGLDPVQFRLAHTTDQRMIDIIKKVAEAAHWQPRPSPSPGARHTGDMPVTGRGMAAMYRFGAYWAGVAEVTVIPSTGVVTVDRFTLAVDVGKIINPRHLRLIAQGGVVMGLSEVLKEELIFDQEKVTSNDWTKYKLLTMAETPEIQIVTLDRNDAGFGGGGEAANSLPQPCVVAAVFDATGVQPRRTPLTPEYVKGLLKA